MTGVHQLLDLSNQGAYADKFRAILLCMNAVAAQQWSPREGGRRRVRAHRGLVVAVATGEHLIAGHDLTPPPVMLAPAEAAQNSFS